MQQDSISLIIDTLNAGKKIKLAGIGVLGLRYIDAHIHPVSRIFSPPHYDVVLYEENEDGQTFPGIDELASGILRQLQDNEEFTVSGLGTFMRTRTGEFVFVPQQSLLDAVNVMMNIMPEFPAAYSERKRPEMNHTSVLKQQNKQKKRFKLWPVIAVLLIGGAAAIYYTGLADPWINASPETMPVKKGSSGVTKDTLAQKSGETDDTVATTTETAQSTVNVGSYFIIVGSYTSLEPAQNDSQIWVKNGYHPSIIPFPEKGRFRLSIEHYPDSTSAKSALPAIRSKVNAGAWILKN